MHSYISKYLYNLENKSRRFKVQPLATAKQNAIAELYNFLLMGREYIYNKELFPYNNGIFEQEFEKLMDQTQVYLERIKQCTSTNELSRVVYEYLVFKVGVPLIQLSGRYYSTLAELDRLRPRFQSRGLKTKQQGCLDELLVQLGKRISVNRPYLNILTADYEGYYEGDAAQENLLQHVAGRIKPCFKRGNSQQEARVYAYARHDDCYEELQHFATGFEKIITGTSTKVKLSQSFDIGIGACITEQYFLRQEADSFDNIRQLTLRLVRHIVKGGVIALVLPHCFCNANVLQFLSNYLEAMEVFYPRNYQQLRLVMLVGKKKEHVKADPEAMYELMAKLLQQDYVPREQYTIVNPVKGRPTFRSAFPDKYDLERVLARGSNYMEQQQSRLLKELGVTEEQQEQYSLQPFSNSHLALLLVSGHINGVVEEPNGNYHLIKGTVVKQRSMRMETNGLNQNLQTIVYSNNTSVKMLMADGTLKILM